jgi:tetratricopeptide (TPR) repeat protein
MNMLVCRGRAAERNELDWGILPERGKLEGMATSPQTVFRQTLLDAFTEEELRTLCSDLNVEYDHLPGYGMEAKARELVEYLRRTGRAAELVEACRRARPAVEWPELPPPRSLPLVGTERPAWLWPAVGGVGLLILAILAGLILRDGDPAAPTATVAVVEESETRETAAVVAPTDSDSPTVETTAEHTPTPSAPALPPDVIISEFDAPAGTNVQVARRVEESLEELLASYDLEDVNLQVVEEPITSREQAEAVAAESGSQVVVWGWYDDLGINVRLYLAVPDDRAQRLVRTNELPLTDSGDQEAELALAVRQTLPQNISFLSLFIIGHLKYLANDYQQGHAAFDAAMNSLPENVTFENEALLHFFRARQLFTAGADDAQALNTIACEYATAIAADPEFAAAYNNLGVVLLQYPQETLPEAAQACLANVEVEDTGEEFGLAYLLFNQAVELEPAVAVFRYNQLSVLWHRPDVDAFDLADEAAELAELDPSLPGPYLMQAAIDINYFDWEAAENHLRQALAVLPDDPLVMADLAQTHLLQDEADEAVALLEEALPWQPADAELRLALANAYYQAGDYEAAVATLVELPRYSVQYPVEEVILNEIDLVVSLDIAPGLQETTATSPYYMGDVLRAAVYFRQGEREAAEAELAALLEHVTAIQAAYELPTQGYPLLRLALGLLQRARGDEVAAAATWAGLTFPAPFPAGTLVEQTSDFDAWWRLQVNCGVDSEPLDLTQESLPDCLPDEPDDRAAIVFDTFSRQLAYRLRYQTLPVYGLACPYLYTLDETAGWRLEGAILVGLAGEAAAGTQAGPLTHFDGRLLIRELEPEITHLDEVYVVVIDSQGQRTTLRPGVAALQAADGVEVILNQGDELLLEFIGFEQLNDARTVWVVVRGYYNPTSGRFQPQPS